MFVCWFEFSLLSSAAGLEASLSFALTSYFLRFGAVLKAIIGLSGKISFNVGSLRIGLVNDFCNFFA